jgi:hypothetical protein
MVRRLNTGAVVQRSGGVRKKNAATLSETKPVPPSSNHAVTTATHFYYKLDFKLPV